MTDRVATYYDETWGDYRKYWLDDQNLAMHIGFWDERTRTHPESLLNMNRVLADRIRLRPGERVLDAGCGVGGSSLWLAEHRGARVTGIGVAESQLGRARAHAADRGLDDAVTFEQADYARTPYGDESFDAVWAIESVCHAASPPAFYREAARLLRPAGRLVVADGMRRRRPLDRRGESLLRRWADGWAVPDINTPEEHLGFARAAGLEDVRLDDVTRHGRRSMLRMVAVVLGNYPFNLARRIVGRRTDLQQRNTNAVFPLFRLALRDGCLYGILTAAKPRG